MKVYEVFCTGYDLDDNEFQDWLGLFESRDEAQAKCYEEATAMHKQLTDQGEPCQMVGVEKFSLTSNAGTGSARVYNFFVVERTVQQCQKKQSSNESTVELAAVNATGTGDRSCSMRVVSGDTTLFVHGSHEAIEAARKIALERAELRSALAAARELLADVRDSVLEAANAAHNQQRFKEQDYYREQVRKIDAALEKGSP